MNPPPLPDPPRVITETAALTEEQRQHLFSFEPDVFGPLRNLTMTGMFSHPEHGGNYQKIGWRLIGYADQYSWAPPFGYYDRSQS